MKGTPTPTPTPAKRTDRASRVVHASAAVVYRAFVDPEALVAWLPPRGMTGKLEDFDARAGGGYRMTLRYEDAATSDEAPGKTTANEDVVAVRFVDLVPGERIVQLGLFESDDPAFGGTMRMTWRFERAPAGAGGDATEVSVTCEDVPVGISEEDHAAGLSSSLENLAAFVEEKARGTRG